MDDSKAIKTMFGALANPIRLDILHALNDGEKNVTELVTELKRDQSLISHNLKRLTSSKLIVSRKEGQFRYYSLNHQAVAPLLKSVSGMRQFMLGKSDEAARKVQARYDLLVRMMPMALFTQLEGKITFANRVGFRLLGAKGSEEIVGRPVVDFVAPEDHPELLRRFKLMAEGRKLTRYECRMIRTDGRAVDVLVAEEPIEEGGQKGCIAVLVDITAKKELERRLEVNESLIKMALDASGVVAWEWDLRNNQVLTFGNAEAVFGTKPLNGKAIWAMIHPDDQAMIRADFDSHVKTPTGRYVRRFRIIRPDNHEIRTIEMRARILIGDKGERLQISGISRDLTDELVK